MTLKRIRKNRCGNIYRELGGRDFEGSYGSLKLAPGYVYSTGTPEELYQATGGSSWGGSDASEVVVFRGRQHPYGIAPHATIAKSEEILGRFAANLIDFL